MSQRLAVIGAGWAGCAAAVQAVDEGFDVTLYEMASHLGGRARRVDIEGLALDNGQHILMGAYTECLRLMRQVGVRTTLDLLRTPLQLIHADGSGLRLGAGRAAPALLKAIAAQRGWTRGERLALLRQATLWTLRRFRCAPELTVAQLCANLPVRVRDELIDPLCAAALNTPAHRASAAVFLRVLRDTLGSGPGSSDLLLPRTHLSALFPDPAARWLERAGARVRRHHRVTALQRHAPHGWRVDGEAYDAVILACPPGEAARLCRPHAPAWAEQAESLSFEPIVTVYAHADGARLPQPMLALRSHDAAPAQYVFDRGQLNGPTGLLAFVISAASPWVSRGLEATAQAVCEQAHRELSRYLRPPLRVIRSIVEKRATFLCEPGLQRPSATIAPGLWAAGDHVNGPYPATLEGAVRAGVAAARLAAASLR
ncbi:MAG: amine oxidoreductase [Caldimonas sp.]|nr:MAG: amine oxidoreductase [Caldimonas sp.]